MNDFDPQRLRITLETARINWHDLQLFYARGQVIHVQAHLDLVEVAQRFTENDTESCQRWLLQNAIGRVSDYTAQRWHESRRELWAVVIAPWVLVQDQNDCDPSTLKH